MGIPVPTPGALAYAGNVAAKFHQELGVPLPGIGRLYTPIEPHEPPRSFRLERRPSKLGSLLHINNQMIAVDDALKMLIERLEPDTHRFYSIRIELPKGEELDTAYHIMCVGRHIDSFAPEASDARSWSRYPGHPEFFYYRYEPQLYPGISGLALSRSIFDGAHFWRERRFNGILFCLSDRLRDEIVADKLLLPKLIRMREV